MGRVYSYEVPLERESSWNELRYLIADLMVLAGLVVIGLGVYYFSESWRAATFVLLFAAAFGSLLFGSGTLIHGGATRRRLTMSSLALGLSSALTLALCSVLGPQPALLIVIAVPSAGLLDQPRTPPEPTQGRLGSARWFERTVSETGSITRRELRPQRDSNRPVALRRKPWHDADLQIMLRRFGEVTSSRLNPRRPVAIRRRDGSARMSWQPGGNGTSVSEPPAEHGLFGPKSRR